MLESAIKSLKEQGLSQIEIAEELNISQAYVSKLSKRFGIKWPIGYAGRNQYGHNNPNYLGGISKATLNRRTKETVVAIGKSLNICERCDSFRELPWPRHHKDRDKRNNNPDNIEVLCCSCHNKEHLSERDRDSSGRFLCLE